MTYEISDLPRQQWVITPALTAGKSKIWFRRKISQAIINITSYRGMGLILIQRNSLICCWRIWVSLCIVSGINLFMCLVWFFPYRFSQFPTNNPLIRYTMVYGVCVVVDPAVLVCKCTIQSSHGILPIFHSLLLLFLPLINTITRTYQENPASN